MEYKELRKLFEEHFSSFPNVKKYGNYSVINKGFQGNFNLSFSEPEMLEEFGSLINIKHDLLYTKIQQCIRIEDFLQILVPLSKKSYQYLGIFDLAGICLCYSNSKDIINQTKNLIKHHWNFLINKLQLNSNNLFIKCFNGGNIFKVTNGKYKINKKIEKDNVSINEWVKLGLPQKNILLDNTRDTLLALHLDKPTPWGYRTEILYKLKNGDFLDIGTIEYFLWKPVFKNGNIVDITKWEYCCCLAGFGLERLNFVKNNLKHIRECNHINPIFTQILNDSKNKNEDQSFLLTECIRTSQRILTDSKGYATLSIHRKKKLTKYIQEMFRLLENLEIPKEKIKGYLKTNAKLQPWYPELNKNIDLVYRELIEAFSRKFKKHQATF